LLSSLPNDGGLPKCSGVWLDEGVAQLCSGSGAGAGIGAGAGLGFGAAAFGAAAGLGAAFFAGAFLALAFLADFFGAADFFAVFLADFFADFFADFLAFFADFLADFFEDFLADFFFAVTTFLVFLAFLPFFFLPLAIVILLLPPINVYRAFKSSASKPSTQSHRLKVIASKTGPIDQFNPGRGPPVAQSRSSTV
jgi:hypothetical protein